MPNCSICNEDFSSRNKLFIHIRSSHQELSKVSQTSEAQQATKYDLVQYSTVEVITEDDDWYRIVLKPQGLATMGSDGSDLLQHSVLLMPERFQPHVSYRKAIPCHRLDRLTGGIVVCSKSKVSETMIKLCFRHKLIQKCYRAIVAGNIECDDGVIDTPVGGKEAATRYEVIHRTPSHKYGTVTTLNLWPVTGRRHQLRKHLQSEGHSIIGDTRYSHASSWPLDIERLFLWAVEISFPHPMDVSRAVLALNVDIDDLAQELKNYNSEDEEEDQPVSSTITIDPKRRRLDSSTKGSDFHFKQPSGPEFSSKLKAALKDCTPLVVRIDEPRYFEQFRQNQCQSVEELELKPIG
jgi:23S rRNA-/tRNA-specific pseudouridylate synthase